MFKNTKYNTELSEPKKMALIREYKNELIKALELPKAFDNLNEQEQQKQLLYKQMSDLGEQIFSSVNPRFLARKCLMDNLLKLSSLEVLYPNENPLQIQISGKLFPYLKQMIIKNQSLAPLFQSFQIQVNSSEDEYLNALEGSMFVFAIWNKSLHIIRQLLEDLPDENEKDWADPCYNSFCISHEFVYRNELNLPQFVTDRPNFETEVRLHAAWLEILEQDPNDLRQAWGDIWKKTTSYDDPFKELGH